MEIDFCPIDPSKKCNCPNKDRACDLIESLIKYYIENKNCTREEAIGFIKESADSDFRATFIFPRLAKDCKYSNTSHVY